MKKKESAAPLKRKNRECNRKTSGKKLQKKRKRECKIFASQSAAPQHNSAAILFPTNPKKKEKKKKKKKTTNRTQQTKKSLTQHVFTAGQKDAEKDVIIPLHGRRMTEIFWWWKPSRADTVPVDE
eukprot:TRINITY_DN216_c0_g2_i11.p1 TRINITY_DN216_c0_g2~~TRINITY_DN216_c0_g2_i11.p1  ORF type:complete len:125 (+),score=7.91 TRINITY_DN216_c0_g2_i11:290-664(+)